MAAEIDENKESMVSLLEEYQAEFSRKGTMASSSSLKAIATDVSCKGQEYKTPHSGRSTPILFFVF